MAANLKTVEEPLSFRRKQNHELKALFKSIDKASKKIVDTLELLMDHPDPKIKMAAASKLADLLISTAEHINKDQITRLLLESKNPDRVPHLSLEDDDDTPQVNFTDIIDT